MLYRAENLRRTHGARTVLDIESLAIEPGRIYTLIGPNGAGKTTLLKILAFLDRPTDGDLYFQDRKVDGGERQLNELRRRVVLLDQYPIMFTGSVQKNVEFGLKIRKVPQSERRGRILDALDVVGMAGFLDYKARSLSGGETKRVALARALVLQPEVLLFDEPTANVDNENQEIILRIIERINQEHNTSIIFSTHYLSQGQRLADRTLLLQHGMLSHIVNENIFRATVVCRRHDSLTCELTGQVSLELPVRIFPADASAAKVHIDPEKIELAREPGPEPGNLMSGHIIGLEQDRGRVRAAIDVGVKLVLFLAVEGYRSTRPAIGDRVQIFIPHSAIHCSPVNLP